MKLSITPSEQYPCHELEVADWLAEEKKIENMNKSEVTIIRQTEKAYLTSIGKLQLEIWLPKSQCKIIKRLESKLNSF